MNTIRKQGISNAIIIYLGAVIGFVSLMFIQPHLLQAKELGLTRILVAAASLIATVLPLGISSVTTRFFPYFRNEEKKHFGYFGFMLLVVLAGTLLSGIIVYVFKKAIIAEYIEQSPLFVDYYDLLLPLAMVMGINIALNSYSASLFRTTLVTFLESIYSRLAFVLLIVLYYFHYLTLSQFIGFFVFSYFIQALWLCLYVFSIDKPSMIIDREQFRKVGLSRLFGYGLLLTLTNISSLSMKYFDTVLIGHYLNLEAVGVFAVGAYISVIIEIPLNSLEKISHAKVSQAWANNDTESIKAIYYQSVKYLMLIGGLLVVGIITNVNELFMLLPESYAPAIPVTVISCIAAFLNVATGVNTSIIYSSSKYLYGTILLAILLVLAVGLNMWLIPLYGIMGAAIATGLLAIVYNATKYIIILVLFKMQPYDLSSLKIIFVIAVSFLTAWLMPLFKDPVVTMACRAAATTAVYCGLAYFLKIAPELHKYIPGNK
ncbi:MAG: oligosaccharide flippase family protein [Bacteroidia bacterium]